MNFLFGVITDGWRPAKLRATLDSIWSQGIDRSALQVSISGDICRAQRAVYMESVHKVDAKDAAANGRLGEMRNKLVDHAVSVTASIVPACCVIISDDDMIFAPDFCEKIATLEGPWDVLCPRIENPDGSRYWDWATYGGPRKHALLSYDEEPDQFWYNTGGMLVARLNVFGHLRWPDKTQINNHLEGGENEDLIFSRALWEEGLTIRTNPKSVVVHDDPRLTSKSQSHIYRVGS